MVIVAREIGLSRTARVAGFVGDRVARVVGYRAAGFVWDRADEVIVRITDTKQTTDRRSFGEVGKEHGCAAGWTGSRASRRLGPCAGRRRVDRQRRLDRADRRGSSRRRGRRCVFGRSGRGRGFG
ncbi:hypothetical protein V565_130960 [Rhizoctonia solani 123E]|uniref:Uncharacterized protein n=1 Tax=Rhizoctonia solani 123E TaxID=1423351 RepID=A0A074RMZ7_9AGAM|nr:hypothetical protein V565_130960 [Rhizoctonia solani 123E]